MGIMLVGRRKINDVIRKPILKTSTKEVIEHVYSSKFCKFNEI